MVDTYRGPWRHGPGQVLSDMAVAVADGAQAITGIQVLGDREGAFGKVASMPTAWRALDRVDADHLPAVRAARATRRESRTTTMPDIACKPRPRRRLAIAIHHCARMKDRG